MKNSVQNAKNPAKEVRTIIYEYFYYMMYTSNFSLLTSRLKSYNICNTYAFLKVFVGMKQIVNFSAVIVIQNVLAVHSLDQHSTATLVKNIETMEVVYHRVQKTSKLKHM